MESPVMAGLAASEASTSSSTYSGDSLDHSSLDRSSDTRSLAEAGFRARAVTPPRFHIDLSRPPAERYSHVVPIMREVLAASDRVGKEDGIGGEDSDKDGETANAPGRRTWLQEMAAHARDRLPGGLSSRLPRPTPKCSPPPPKVLHRLVAGLLDEACRGGWLPRGAAAVLRRTTAARAVVLRRVYDGEEQAELEGLARAAPMPLHLLVALNVLVDLMMGCSAGGVRVVDSDEETGESGSSSSHMVHLRTMDWPMPALRRLVVELDYVRQPGGPVAASALTYFGYVGVVTGVRRGLSMSVNFRPTHARDSLRQRAAFRAHQALVLLGWRPSVASLLRRCLLTPDGELDGEEASLASTSPSTTAFPPTTAVPPTTAFPSTPALDLLHRLPGAASTAAYLLFCTPQTAYLLEKDHGRARVRASTTELLVCNHDGDQDDSQGSQDSQDEAPDRPPSSRARLAALRAGLQAARGGHAGSAVALADVVALVQDARVCHAETHYAAVLDPAAGRIVWRAAYEG